MTRSMLIDVNALIGPHPFRYVPHPDADALVRVMHPVGLVLQSAAYAQHPLAASASSHRQS